ncbi:MAG: S9 family peptidase [Acidobacteriota bacterium]|nr:S9 family peptidase [Acidobacteriota bacterium]
MMRALPFLLALPLLAQTVFTSRDLLQMRSVGQVALSPDATQVAYTVLRNDGPGRPSPDLYIRRISDGRTTMVGAGGAPEWSPDGQWIAYSGSLNRQSGLILVHSDGSAPRFLTEVKGTNSPLPTTGKTVAWSPDGKRIAFISAAPGPETAAATGDPVVITRYLYKPDAAEGMTRFNDNRRLHIFLLDLATGKTRQLTTGDYYEHSIDWSPNGQDLAFVSNREPNQDQFFNYDLFTLHLADGGIHRLTATESAEYRPRWSPDGKTLVYEATKRGLTDLETTMEDTHVWLIGADGRNRRELVKIDNRQGEPGWSPDGSAVLFTVQEHGSTHLYRQPAAGGSPEILVAGKGGVTSWSISRNNTLACALVTPGGSAELFIGGKQVTDLNAAVMKDKPLAPVESFTFISNDNKWEVEAFLTVPPGLKEGEKAPLITVIHGGPHGQQGPGFNFRNQVYASHGWSTLMVNYRGSTGYGQAFTDAVFGDQDGNEAQDVLYGVSAAMRRYPWIDRDRLGVEGVSYGGQLSAWLITQTNMFKAAIPVAAITNLISYNYMTYYNQYEEMEFGAFPHQGNLMDVLWERSALKHVAGAHTPTMLMHGENDNDVPIAEAEQFYIALKDVGTEAVMVRYPREGHGIRESKHQVDSIDRSIAWYEQHFPRKN